MDHNPEYFPRLIFPNLIKFANKWAQKYRVIQRITLYWCIDSAFFRSKYVRYVVVFEFLPELQDDHPDFKRFLSDFVNDVGLDNLLDERFIDVYQKEPDFRFRDEWEFLYKFSDEELPSCIEHEHLWHLFPQETTDQKLIKDRKEPSNLIEKDIPNFSYYKNNDIWIIGKEGEEKPWKDMDGLNYIHFLLRYPNDGISIINLHDYLKGLIDTDKEDVYYGNMTEEQLLNEYGLSIERVNIIDRMSDKKTREVLFQEKENLQKRKDEIRLGALSNPEKAVQEIEEINVKISEIQDYLKKGKRKITTKKKDFLNNTRINIFKSIDRACDKISKKDPLLKEFINKKTIKTGYYCSYNPDPQNPVQWVLYPDTNTPKNS